MCKSVAPKQKHFALQRMTEAVNLERLSCRHQALLHADRTSQRLVQLSAAPTPTEITHSLGLCQITKWNFLGKTPVCSAILPRAEEASSASAKASSSPSPSSSLFENDILRIRFEIQPKRDWLQKLLNEERQLTDTFGWRQLGRRWFDPCSRFA